MAAKMGPRELKALLGLLKAHDVTSYTDGSISIQLGGRSQQEVPPFEATTDTAGDTGPPELPDGILDPVAILQRINRRKAAS